MLCVPLVYTPYIILFVFKYCQFYYYIFFYTILINTYVKTEKHKKSYSCIFLQSIDNTSAKYIITQYTSSLPYVRVHRIMHRKGIAMINTSVYAAQYIKLLFEQQLLVHVYQYNAQLPTNGRNWHKYRCITVVLFTRPYVPLWYIKRLQYRANTRYAITRMHNGCGSVSCANQYSMY